MFRPPIDMSMASLSPARLFQEARWVPILAAIMLSATFGSAQEKPSAHR